MAIENVEDGTAITTAWGNSVADAINDLPIVHAQKLACTSIAVNAMAVFTLTLNRTMPTGYVPVVTMYQGASTAGLCSAVIQSYTNSQVVVKVWNQDSAARTPTIHLVCVYIPGALELELPMVDEQPA